jgi:NADPH:quinone reductase-like Zn-dependent oxidoreductase
MPTPTLPTQMRAVLLEKQDEDPVKAIEGLKIVTRPVPKPGRGQVLIRIEAAPANPSDIMFLAGRYGLTKTLPTVPGFEASGTVVASGGGFMANFLVGKRVACGGQSDSDGTWAEYFCGDAAFCIPLQKGVDLEQGAMLIVNPLTALALFDKCVSEGHRAAVHSAGASQLGRMLIRLANDSGYPLINLVRREDQRQLLLGLGAKIVLDTSRPDFIETFKSEAARLGATLLLDAVAGPMVGQLLKVMPDGSKASVYGGLSQQACGEIDPIDLIFHGKSVEGFWLTPWLQGKNLLGKLKVTGQVQKLIAAKVFGSEIRARLKLDQVKEGLLDYQRHMSEGKVLICPGLR